MARNGGRRWTATQKQTVRSGARRRLTTLGIARKVGRTSAAVRAEASRLKVSLKPKD